MSISSQLLILNQTKGNIKQAIDLKGVSVTDEAFAEYPDKVRLIPSGTGTYESDIILYVEAKQENVVIPAGTTSIGDYAFECSHSDGNRLNMKTVSMPDTVTAIGKYAFHSNENLSTINLSNTLSSIGMYAFSECQSIQTITLPASMRTIGNDAFRECESLESITLNEGLTSIGERTFGLCYSLLSVTIPSTVTTIGNGAFWDCNSLTEFICLPTVPPTGGSNVLQSTNDCPIYVPDESVLAYQVADGWNTYSSRIKGISEKPQ